MQLRLFTLFCLLISNLWAITQVQRAPLYISSANATTHTVTFGSTPTNGNLLVLAGASNDVISTPAGWTLAVQGIDFKDVKIFYKTAGVSEPTGVTVTIGSSTSCALVAWEYSGMAASSQLDKTASATAQGPTAHGTGTTAATAQASELLIAVVGTDGTNTMSTSGWSNSFTAELDGDTTGSAGFETYITTSSRIVSATATYTTTATTSTSGSTHDSGVIATFKAAAGGGPPVGQFPRVN
jgi:hypothetical protein